MGARVTGRVNRAALHSWVRSVGLTVVIILSTVPLRAHAASTQGVCVPPPPGASHSKRSLALIIGISDYNGDGSASSDPTGTFLPDLPNARPDGEEVARKLCTLGWLVTHLQDPTREELITAVADFGSLAAANQEATALIYYAGHAIQVEGENWLLPKLASLPLDQDLSRRPPALRRALLEGQGVRLQLLLGQIAARGGGQPANVVFVDACRENPWDRLWGRTRGEPSEYLAREESQSAAQMSITYTTFSGGLASDGPLGGHSPFAAAFLRLVGTPGLPLGQMMAQIDEGLRRETGGRQRLIRIVQGGAGERMCPAGCGPSRAAEPSPTGQNVAQNDSGILNQAQQSAALRCILGQRTEADARRVTQLSSRTRLTPRDFVELGVSLNPYVTSCRAGRPWSDVTAQVIGNAAFLIHARPVLRRHLVNEKIDATRLERWFAGQPAEYRRLPFFDESEIERYIQETRLGEAEALVILERAGDVQLLLTALAMEELAGMAAK